MDEEKQDQRSCLIQGHRGQNFIIKICLDRDCQLSSNTLCCDCIFEHLHEDCKYTLLSLDCRYNKFEFRLNEEASKVKDYYNYLKTQQYKEIEKVEKVFEQIKDEYLELLNKMKKEEKIKISDYYGQLEQDLKQKFNFFSKYEKLGNIQEVEYQVKNFNDIEKLNEFLQEFKQERFFTSNEILQISQLYGKTQQIEEDIQQELEQLQKDFHIKFKLVSDNFLNKHLFRIQKISNNNGGQQLQNGQFIINNLKGLSIISRNFYNFKDDVKLKFQSKSGKKMDIGIKLRILNGLTFISELQEDIYFSKQDDFIQLLINLSNKKLQIEFDKDDKYVYDFKKNLDQIDQYRIKIEILNYQDEDFQFIIL